MIFDDFSLKGKAALVTGGGNGIGSGITKGLAEAGASIACVYRTRPPVEMQRYVEGLGRRFLPIQADVGQMPQLKAIMEQTLNAFGRLDILVNNAGICPRASALEYTEEMWDNIIQVNQKSVFFLSQMAARQFVRQGGGRSELYSTGIGRLFLAQESDEEVERYLNRVEIKRLTDRTVMDKSALMELIRQARRDGYSGNVGENEPYVCSLCAPIYGQTGKMIAGISLCGMQDMIFGKKSEQYLHEIRAAAAEISKEMGYVE